jgi:trehalose synthase
VRPLPPERLAPLIGSERTQRFEAIAAEAREILAGRVVLNFNSTATGGGVAELLQTLLAYGRGAGIDTRWAVIEGNGRFFEITKRIHNHLYGGPGDGGPLGAEERRDYEAVLRENISGVTPLVRPGDIVLLHDPQTAGLAPILAQQGVKLVWRCHVGIDKQNEHSERGWAFLKPYFHGVDAFVFSCPQFAPPFVSPDQLTVIPPSIDPFAAKNEPMEPDVVVRVLQQVGLLAGSDGNPVGFTRRDGTPGEIARPVELHGTGPVPFAEVPVVLQASRWDAVKDMRGVMHAFAQRLDAMGDAHLVLAGPASVGVADDPEAEAVLADCLAAWQLLPAAARARVHLACVPMGDPDEAAAIVNALQRHATIVTQKSLAEGFGLTVAEAMWKSRPVVGSAVGGIIDQIVHGECGALVADPLDLEAFAAAVAALLADEPGAAEMGRKAQVRANDRFLGDRHLEQWAALFATFLSR